MANPDIKFANQKIFDALAVPKEIIFDTEEKVSTTNWSSASVSLKFMEKSFVSMQQFLKTMGFDSLYDKLVQEERESKDKQRLGVDDEGYKIIGKPW